MASDIGAQDTDHKAHGQPPPAQKGGAGAKTGEGGEAYLTDGGPKDTRIRFYRDIELMRGHLLVGQQLIELDLWDEALPHFLHPSEELYGLMEKYIKLHRMQPFKRELQALAQTVKAKRKGAHEQALKVVEQRLDAALGVAKRFMTPGAQLHHQVGDRGAADRAVRVRGLHGGRRFVKPVEYQDSRGFVWQAERMIEAAAAPDRSRSMPPPLAKVRAAFATLKTAWPAPMPPPKPILDAGQISALISEIELHTSRP